jgi:hypothetical protein
MNKNDNYVVGILKSQFIFTSCKDCEYFHPGNACNSNTDSLLFKILEPDTFAFEDFFDAVKYATGMYIESQEQSVIFKRENYKLKLVLKMGIK